MGVRRHAGQQNARVMCACVAVCVQKMGQGSVSVPQQDGVVVVVVGGSSSVSCLPDQDVPCLFCCCTRMSSSCFLQFWKYMDKLLFSSRSFLCSCTSREVFCWSFSSWSSSAISSFLQSSTQESDSSQAPACPQQLHLLSLDQQGDLRLHLQVLLRHFAVLLKHSHGLFGVWTRSERLEGDKKLQTALLTSTEKTNSPND